MKSTTLIFNVAGIIAVIGVIIGLVDLMRHKTTTYGVTPNPTTNPVPTPTPAAAATA